MIPLARIVHISDVHFGRIRTSDIVSSLIDQVNALNPTVVVVSGDITQRARRVQLREAAEFISSFQSPSMVIPGNHDVYAWWYAHYRLTKPLARYEKYISADLSPVFETPELRMVGINSSHGWTVKGGKFSKEDIAAAGSFFEHGASQQFKVLVVHHHLLSLDQLGKHDVAVRGNKLLDTAIRTKVRLVLCGHLHVSHVEEHKVNGQQIVISSAGTATSDRGRHSNAAQNYFNIVDVHTNTFDITEMRFEDSSRKYVDVRTSVFER